MSFKNNNNITMRNYKKSICEGETIKSEHQQTIKTATFEDMWRIKKFKEIFPKSSTRNPIPSPEFQHSFNGHLIKLNSRVYYVNLHEGLLVIETIVKGIVESDIMKVQSFLRDVRGQDFHLSTSKRDNGRFKHITQSLIVMNETNGLIPNGVLTVLLKITISIREDYNSVRDARLADDFGTLLQTGNFSDITLLVNGEKIKAHKGILACRSSTFASLFNSESCDVMDIANYDVDIVKGVLSFCYTGWVDEVSLDLLRASEEFDIAGLKIICEDDLVRNFDTKNAAEFLVRAEESHAPTLRKKAIKFVAEHLKEIVKTSMFEHISHATLLEIMRQWEEL